MLREIFSFIFLMVLLTCFTAGFLAKDILWVVYFGISTIIEVILTKE